MHAYLTVIIVSLLSARYLRAECTSQQILITKRGGDSTKPPLVSSISVTSIYRNSHRGINIFAYENPLPSFFYSWCSGETDVLPNVTITLTEPVVLHGLLSGGLISEYVTNFSMEYSESEDGPQLQHDPLGNLLVKDL